MDNPSRSERTRKAAIHAALTVIARDGPGRLTLDAIAREAGMSKGGLMHQFPSKHAVLKALLAHQSAHFDEFRRGYVAKLGSEVRQPELNAQIATLREAASRQNPITFAVLGALAEDPTLLSASREGNAQRLAAITAEADDADLALLRHAAAQGLALSFLLGLSALSDKDRARLFGRLLDDEQWPAPVKSSKRPSAKTKTR